MCRDGLPFEYLLLNMLPGVREQSRRWQVRDPGSVSGLPSCSASIEVTFEGMESGRQGWTRCFQDAGIASCEVIYEDFEIERAGAAREILDLVDPEPDRLTIEVAGSRRGREADQYSLSWCKRFLGAASSAI